MARLNVVVLIVGSIVLDLRRKHKKIIIKMRIKQINERIMIEINKIICSELFSSSINEIDDLIGRFVETVNGIQRRNSSGKLWFVLVLLDVESKLIRISRWDIWPVELWITPNRTAALDCLVVVDIAEEENWNRSERVFVEATIEPNFESKQSVQK